MPVARGEYGQACRGECKDVLVEHGNDFVPVRHCQAATGNEVVLHVDDDERIRPAQFDARRGRAAGC